jgi:hypothetical protein
MMAAGRAGPAGLGGCEVVGGFGVDVVEIDDSQGLPDIPSRPWSHEAVGRALSS